MLRMLSQPFRKGAAASLVVVPPYSRACLSEQARFTAGKRSLAEASIACQHEHSLILDSVGHGIVGSLAKAEKRNPVARRRSSRFVDFGGGGLVRLLSC